MFSSFKETYANNKTLVWILSILAIGLVGLGIGLSLKKSEKEDAIQTYRSSYTAKYCSPNNQCWPNATVWQVFGNTLSEGAILTEQFSNDYRTCERQGSDARKILNSGDGICMQYHNCKYEFCEVSQGTWNIPEYTVTVKKVGDIQAAINFANDHNIPVTIKTTGHNYAGSSTGRGTLNIYMKDFEEGTTMKTNSEFSDTCGGNFENTIEVGGGQIWEEVYKAVGSDYHIVGGGGLTVSAAGGWLQWVYNFCPENLVKLNFAFF